MNNNKILDISAFEKVNFQKLIKLDISGNEISDIMPLKKANLDKLQYLNIIGCKGSNIGKLNFKELIILSLSLETGHTKRIWK